MRFRVRLTRFDVGFPPAAPLNVYAPCGGASWSSEPRFVRSAARKGRDPSRRSRYNTIGFRLAQD